MVLLPSDRLAFFARTNFRNEGRVFGIRQADRLAHLYVIGKTGTGKSTLIETLIRQDLGAGNGLALLDPHGDLVERVVASLGDRREDVLYLDVPGDPPGSIAFNPLERVPPAARPRAAGGILEVFRKLWAESWGPRLEHLLRNALFLLLDQPEATLGDVLRLLDDAAFRKRAAERSPNFQIRRFWLREYEAYPSRFRAEAVAPLQNKVGAFLADPLLRRILSQPKSSFDIRRIMDEGRILLVNLSKGRLGEDTAGLLGSLLVSSMGLAALGRADRPESERRDFFLYLDEFQSFTTLSVATMLAELRKYHVGFILAHQYLGQLEPEVRDAVLGNVGTMIAFRVGAPDAEILEKEFEPEFRALDLTRLPNYNIYLKLMVRGAVAAPFSAETLPPFP